MRHLYLLFKVELKKIRLALFGLPLMYGIIALYLRNGDYSQGNLWGVVSLLIIGTIFVPPAMFAFLVNDELKFSTVYQLFSIPGRRYKLLLSKYLTAVTVCAMTTIGTVATMSLRNNAEYFIFGTKTFYESVITSFIFITWLTGITCMTAGIVLSTKRYRHVIAVIIFLVLMFLSSKVIDIVELVQWSEKHCRNGMLSLIGIVFVMIGLVIYEKYGEI